ncbi:MAG: hypothetical protein KME28_07090 [Pelatocladus maniniholoensis HA4357-MV3]|jgi:hypothetical protein|uniref:Uncharacterized protein n=1 Tax=Pelatocladus maniniholoensis HA4357-MV3 TaxID=1117104 RepID=A0A9E3LS77_9NOST|nr:hypothetical protein [Pelatocladus maniniholoensis HA4357-MV3]BAZ69909.1 hypothetical protein NIES4106_46900 [Fischerella sp. NIES-4106]
MKLNSTVVLTLTLLALMLGAGSVSAFLGFDIGSKALKGVTAPDSRPTTKFASAKSGNSQHEGLVLLKEQEILKTVKARIEGKTKTPKSEQEEDETVNNKQKPQDKPQTEVEEKPQPGFPVSAENEGVSLSVQSARYSGGALQLRVKMQNKSKDSVRFLYSFLDVSDDKGRTLSASTDGLPSELPNNSPTYTGTVSIPTALLDDVKSISLSLTDYPAQQLNLEVLDIPVGRQ